MLAILGSLTLLTRPVTAQDSGNLKYSDQVVAKAEAILAKAGIRQSAKILQSTSTSEISRVISGLSRERRELRLIQKEWQEAAMKVSAIRQEIQRLNIQSGELGRQLALVAGLDVTANNRIVGLMNAAEAKSRVLVEERESLKEESSSRRAKVNAAESTYAETVLALRKEFIEIRNSLMQALESEDVKIALKVMHTNFETPETPSADEILAPLNKRIERIEQEVFSETIPLVVEQRSMYVNVVIGKKSTRMVVDSGATMICLPQKTAKELGIIVPPDAREMLLVLADGRSIPARGVTLPRVRVGQFESENVDAAVLDASANEAEPLLGMSFLGNFKFEIDPADRTLKLLRIESE